MKKRHKVSTQKIGLEAITKKPGHEILSTLQKKVNKSQRKRREIPRCWERSKKYADGAPYEAENIHTKTHKALRTKERTLTRRKA